MKIYAKQVPPEYQEGPLFWDDSITNGIELFGNRSYNRRTSKLFDALPNILDELFSTWCDFIDGCPRAWYESWAAALADIAPPEGRPEYTREERKNAWPALLEDWQNNNDENGVFCRALELITGRAWDYCTLRGCCQGDWQYCIYPAGDWDGDALERLEAEYFNTGTEWIAHDENDAPEGPEDINGFSVYCTAWNNDGIRAEIAAAAGVDPGDVILYSFTGWSRTPEYMEVS